MGTETYLLIYGFCTGFAVGALFAAFMCMV